VRRGPSSNHDVISVLVVEAVEQYGKILRSALPLAPSLLDLELLIRHLLFGFAVTVLMIPTFVSRWIVYGGPFDTGYVSIRDFLWWSPTFFSVLFSSNHGLLSWTPLLVLSVLGLFLFSFRLTKLGIPLSTGLVTFYLFVSLYPDWAGISSYGNRFFVSLTPLFILGLAYLAQRVTADFSQRRSAFIACSGVLVFFVLWNLGLMYQFGTHLVPARGPISFRQATYNQFYVVPGDLTSHIRSYLFRRSELMRQIEERDIEQLKNASKR